MLMRNEPDRTNSSYLEPSVVFNNDLLKKLQNLSLRARDQISIWVFKFSAKVKSNFKISISDTMIVFRSFITKLRVILRETIFLEAFLSFIIRMTWRKQ